MLGRMLPGEGGEGRLWMEGGSDGRVKGDRLRISELRIKDVTGREKATRPHAARKERERRGP